MVWQKPSIFSTNQNSSNEHEIRNNCDRPLIDQQDNKNRSKNNLKLTAIYGSGSLDATATMKNRQNHNESSVLVACGDSEVNSRSDGIHNTKNGNGVDFVSDNDVVDDGYYYSYGWKEYFVSWRFVELVVCVFPFLAMGIYFDTTLMQPNMRPMPFQNIHTSTNTGDDAIYNSGSNGDDEDSWGWESYTNVVWNLVNTEKSLGETVTHREYQILAGFCPWLLQLALVWFFVRGREGRCANNFHRWDSFHRTTCMYFVGIGATDIITNSIKYYVGYLRPVFVDACQPHYDEAISSFSCSNEDGWAALDARMSFPSNHSGWSFCGMMLLSMYLERCFGISSIQSKRASVSFQTTSSTTWNIATNNNKIYNDNDNDNDNNKEVLRARDRQALYRLISLLCYTPMLFAFFVAASRVVDNKHFPADVVGGAVLGGAVASLVFGIWFPEELNGVL